MFCYQRFLAGDDIFVVFYISGGHGQQKQIVASDALFKLIENLLPLLVTAGYIEHVQVDGCVQQNNRAHAVAPERIFFSQSSAFCLRASPV